MIDNAYRSLMVFLASAILYVLAQAQVAYIDFESLGGNSLNSVTGLLVIVGLIGMAAGIVGLVAALVRR